jgi:exopolyphosphatase / guanosine-5'-triphosphate,3'-diphosphate pyrophosphatase
MDVKRLQRVDEHGLQQWLPVLKAPFPLAPGDVSTVSAALGRRTPRLEDGPYGLDELLELTGAHAVEVHKLRRRYDLAGCAAELTDIRAGAESSRTIAVESDDPARVAAAVRSLGLPLEPNTCVARGVKVLVGRRFAVVDVGTNSVKFYVADRQDDGTWTTVLERSEVTRLGEGLDRSGRLGAEPVRRTADAIAAMVEEALALGVDDIAAVGTAGLRIAPNRDDLMDSVRERTGLAVEVVPGEEEARLAYLTRRSSSSTRAAAARSSRSGTATASTSSSACPSAPFASRRSSGSTVPSTRRVSPRPRTRSPRRSSRSTAGGRPTP